MYYHQYAQNIEFFKILCTKYMASSEAMTSSTRSFAYSYRLVKKRFVKICETSKCHIKLPYFSTNFHQVSLFCSKNFTLSSEIKLNLFRSSPLSEFKEVICHVLISTIDCCVRITISLTVYEIVRFSHRYLHSGCIHVHFKTFEFLAVY